MLKALHLDNVDITNTFHLRISVENNDQILIHRFDLINLAAGNNYKLCDA